MAVWWWQCGGGSLVVAYLLVLEVVGGRWAVGVVLAIHVDTCFLQLSDLLPLVFEISRQ